MKLNIIYASMSETLEKKVNYFIKGLEVVNISFSTSPGGFYAYILYKEQQEWVVKVVADL